MIHSLSPLLLGLVVAAYWGRVLRMAYKQRRRTGRAANLVPAEPLGKILRLAWTPAVLAWIAQPFITALVVNPPSLLRPVYFSAWIAWPALAVGAGCFYLSLICWRTMGRHWRMGIDPNEKNPIVAMGPFAYVRHPIYALSMLMMLATVAMIPSPLMIAAGAVHITLLIWESRREERYLSVAHGADHDAYRKRVGMFFPNFVPMNREHK